MIQTLPIFPSGIAITAKTDVMFKIEWNPIVSFGFDILRSIPTSQFMHSHHEVAAMYDDQSTAFVTDGFEIPTELGDAIIRGMSEAYLDMTIKDRCRCHSSGPPLTHPAMRPLSSTSRCTRRRASCSAR